MIAAFAVVAAVPVLLTCSVYDADTPTVKLAALAVFVSVSCGAFTGVGPSVSVQRDALQDMVNAWHSALERAIAQAISAGHLRADADAMQMLFEIHGLILALHHDARFLRLPGAVDRARAGFDRIVGVFVDPATASTPARARSARR